MVSEQMSGNICAFSVYTGKSSNELITQNATLDPDYTTTTKTVMGLLYKTKLLDSHRTVFFEIISGKHLLSNKLTLIPHPKLKTC